VSGLGADMAIRMIHATSQRLANAADELSRLDAVAGDGDHGVNMAAAFADADARIAAAGPQSAAEVFMLVGRAFNESGSGSAGVLFGALFATIGGRLDAAIAPEISDLVDGLELASRRVGEIGRSKPGDKTLLDALQPATDAARSTVATTGDAISVLTAAAAAADRGAASTADMRAMTGRARYAATGAVGTLDPGAVAIAHMFRSWADAVDHGAMPGAEGVLGASGNGRARRLDRLATDSGQFAILALDHVRSFATTLRPDDPDSITADEIRELKVRLMEGLAIDASAILVDPALATSRIGAESPSLAAGLIVGIEDGDYAAAAVSPRLLPGWTVERAARLGADAVKISFSFDPDEDTSVAEAFVRETVRECERAELPLFCEPLANGRGGDEVRRHVLEGIRRFGSLGADVLKIQFPCDTTENRSRESWADACAAADDLSPAPWALLSEGREYGEFQELLTIACRAGASGFLAGRAIWGGVAEVPDAIRASSERLAGLRSIAVSEGSPWRRGGR